MIERRRLTFHTSTATIFLAASPRRTSISVSFILPISVAIGQYHTLPFLRVDLLHVTSAKTILKLCLYTMGFSINTGRPGLILEPLLLLLLYLYLHSSLPSSRAILNKCDNYNL